MIIFKQLQDDGYPKKLLEISKNNVNSRTSLPYLNQTNLRYVSAPYIRGVTERVSKLLAPYDIRIASKAS